MMEALLGLVCLGTFCACIFAFFFGEARGAEDARKLDLVAASQAQEVDSMRAGIVRNVKSDASPRFRIPDDVRERLAAEARTHPLRSSGTVSTADQPGRPNRICAQFAIDGIVDNGPNERPDLNVTYEVLAAGDPQRKPASGRRTTPLVVVPPPNGSQGRANPGGGGVPHEVLGCMLVVLVGVAALAWGAWRIEVALTDDVYCYRIGGTPVPCFETERDCEINRTTTVHRVADFVGRRPRVSACSEVDDPWCFEVAGEKRCARNKDDCAEMRDAFGPPERPSYCSQF